MINYFKPDWLDDWKELREKGFLKYVLSNAVIVAVVCAVFDMIVNKRNLFDMETDRAFVNGGIFVAGGFVYAFGSWFYNEWKLKKEQ